MEVFFLVFFSVLAVCIGMPFFLAHVESEKSRARRVAQCNQKMEALAEPIARLQQAEAALEEARDALQWEISALRRDRSEMTHVLGVAKSQKAGWVQGDANQLAATLARYKQAIEILQHQNKLANEVDRAELHPLRRKAQEVELKVRANKRVVEQILTRRAIDEARGASKAPTKGSRSAAAALLAEQIEEGKADGKDTAALEAALEALTEEQL